jgi:hypothetical protein
VTGLHNCRREGSAAGHAARCGTGYSTAFDPQALSNIPFVQVASVAQSLRFNRWSVTYKTYPGGHSLGNRAELEAATRWWLASPAKGK